MALTCAPLNLLFLSAPLCDLWNLTWPCLWASDGLILAKDYKIYNKRGLQLLTKVN